jgi:hypothetical protein
MTQPVTFDFQAWVARYPELADVPPAIAEGYFTEATIYHANDGSGPVADDAQQRALLGMIVAHLAKLAELRGLAPWLVGRISSASEGSVSVSSDLTQLAGTAQWFGLTTYGLNYWFATAPYRTARYRPGPRRMFNPPLPFRGWGF